VAYGVSGYVTDSASGSPVPARVVVNPPDWFTFTDSIGYFHKNLRPGTYSVTATANGYADKTVAGVVVAADTFVNVSIELVPDTEAPTCAFKVVTNKIYEPTPNVNPTNACWALGERDGRRFSLGNGGWATFDMGRTTPIVNGAGTDFTVVEGDADPEACSVFVANDWLGPWYYVGSGTGTQSYDLSAGGQSIARFVRIADDGNGGTGPYAGFDLDAIEAVVVNAPAIVYQQKTVLDSPPGGNNDGKLDPGESAGLLVTLKNAGRVGLASLAAVLRTSDGFVTVDESSADYGAVPPDSSRTNLATPFRVSAAGNTPREHAARMTLYLNGTDYSDSVSFTLVVGEMRPVDPIPDGPRQPSLYWAYDESDAGYEPHPDFNWVEVRGVGTRVTLSDDQTAPVSLPVGFGPFRFYNQNYTQLSVCSNGWVGLGSTTVSTYDETELPNTSMPPMFCLYWDDLYPPTGGGVWYYHDAANHRFVVEYDSVPLYRAQTNYQKLELVLYDATLASPDGNCVAVAQYLIASDLISCTVGEQDPSWTVAIQCLFDGDYNRGCAVLGPGRAIKFATDPPTGVGEPGRSTELSRAGIRLGSNPVSGSARVSYQVPMAGSARLAVYDNSGRLVRLLASGRHLPGEHQSVWDRQGQDGSTVAAGVYWLRLDAASGSAVAKLVLAR
jgi:hypothetical protein